jgi:hypothetical protein
MDRRRLQVWKAAAEGTRSRLATWCLLLRLGWVSASHAQPSSAKILALLSSPHVASHTRALLFVLPQAYAEGRFPPGTSSRDFVRLDASQRHSTADGWTPEETML